MIDLTFFPRRFLNSAALKLPVPGLLTVIFFKDNISFISIFCSDTTDMSLDSLFLNHFRLHSAH